MYTKKPTSVVAVVEAEVVKKWRTPANSGILADQLRRYFLEAKIKNILLAKEIVEYDIFENLAAWKAISQDLDLKEVF